MKFPNLRSGLRLPWFTPNAARPNIFSCEDMNQFVALFNAMLNCPQFKISDNNMLRVSGPKAARPPCRKSIPAAFSVNLFAWPCRP